MRRHRNYIVTRPDKIDLSEEKSGGVHILSFSIIIIIIINRRRNKTVSYFYSEQMRHPSGVFLGDVLIKILSRFLHRREMLVNFAKCALLL